MERKNMVLLTVIAVATLLVAVVGATFAYFTASTSTTGQTEATVTTNKLDGANVTFNSTASKLELLDYPGGLAVYGATATIAKQDDNGDDSNDYQATFNLKITYTNPTSTDLTWELYMVEGEYDQLDATKTTICELQHNSTDSETQLWYSDKKDQGLGVSSDPSDDQGCSGSAIINKLKAPPLNGIKIASGKLKMKQNENKEITKDSLAEADGQQDDGDLSKRTINTKNLPSKYYYLVVKYPNENKDQSETDEAKQIKVALSIDGPAQVSTYKSSD